MTRATTLILGTLFFLLLAPLFVLYAIAALCGLHIKRRE